MISIAYNYRANNAMSFKGGLRNTMNKAGDIISSSVMHDKDAANVLEKIKKLVINATPEYRTKLLTKDGATEHTLNYIGKHNAQIGIKLSQAPGIPPVLSKIKLKKSGTIKRQEIHPNSPLEIEKFDTLKGLILKR